MKQNDRIITCLFVLAEIVLLFFSQFYNGLWINYLRYGAVALCFLYVSFYFAKNKQRNHSDWFFLLGLFFTCLADIFLILQNKHLEMGITAFFITQICYFLYLTKGIKKVWKYYIIVNCLCAIVLFGAAYFITMQHSMMLFLICLYGVTFSGNVLLAVKGFGKHALFSSGLIMFFCCDICVGLSNSALLGIPVSVEAVFFWLIWIFYIPSQVCISIFAAQNRKRA
ncbi:lysoplasmalogenase family protein [[Clostridium] polysaccharolyticum]|uniref:YhhN-like protein n=1 Tax=[Clostridium] polysaccharolyticum TaxID=29364 RepID=A0A1H9ZS38_9FIRM|nr:lysoplasmalogenase family protein [[Clostridium] polysaccharolyticum]SES84504.1 YhhN-like protein [[Clostridium] polysaccharolyticum]